MEHQRSWHAIPLSPKGHTVKGVTLWAKYLCRPVTQKIEGS